MFYNSFVVINHSENTLRVVALFVHKQGSENSAAAYEAAEARIQELYQKLKQPGVSFI
jgi:hypothetical protein